MCAQTARVDWVRGIKWKIPWRHAAQDISSQNLHVRNEDHPQIQQLFDTHFSKALKRHSCLETLFRAGGAEQSRIKEYLPRTCANVVRVVSDSAECPPTELSFEKEHVAGSSSCVVNFVVDMASQTFSQTGRRIHSQSIGRCHELVDDARHHACAMCQGSHSLRTSHGEQTVNVCNKDGSLRHLCWMWISHNDLCTPATRVTSCHEHR